MARSPPLAGTGEEDDDDAHLCLRCRQTIHGLDEYVRHRKAGCGGPSAAEPVQPAPPPQRQDDGDGLKAADFFSQLELQSSNSKTAPAPRSKDAPKSSGMLTRSKSSGSTRSSRQVRRVAVHPRKKAKTPPSRCQDDDDEEDGDAWRYPPRTHTGGKWGPQPPGAPRDEAVGFWREPSSRSPPSTGANWGPQSEGTSQDYTVRSWVEPSPAPPPSAGGKWGPPPSYTGGKWRPPAPVAPPRQQHVDEEGAINYCYEEEARVTSTSGDRGVLHQGEEGVVEEEAASVATHPPSHHTRGKWAPGMAAKVRAVLLGSDAPPAWPSAVRKSGSTVQYWCGSCNRRLASSKMYERHLQSDLHFRRTLLERQLDVGPYLCSGKPRVLRAASTPAMASSPAVIPAAVSNAIRDNEGQTDDEPLFDRRRGSHGERCAVCRVRVHRHQMGKHLVSHYHWRSTRTTAVGSVAADLVLDNIEAVVRQSPFQCGLCKFYCNSSDVLLQHWSSHGHRLRDRQASRLPGLYWCSPCELGCVTSAEMEQHLRGSAHREVEAAVNRSVAVVVSRRTELRCRAAGCSATFRFNAQLTRHERLMGHRSVSTACDRYQARFRCASCGVLRRSRLALQKHKLKCHSEAQSVYFCGTCSLDFSTATVAAKHRLSKAHRDALRDRAALVRGRDRRCPHCRRPCPGLSALRRHVEVEHPQLRPRCALCGLVFTLPQEVSRHHRAVHAAGRPGLAGRTGDAPPWISGSPTSVLPGPEEVAPFTCAPCSFSTESRAEMAFHRVLHGPPDAGVAEGAEGAAAQRYRCPVCARLYRKPALRAHLHVHTGERPFRCAHCDKAFSRKDSCVAHELAAHSPPTPLPSEDSQLQGAISSIVDFVTSSATSPWGRPGEESFASPSAPSNVRRANGPDCRERRHLCDVCGKCFLNKFTLRQHQTSLHGVKPLACPLPHCAVRARSAAELRVHIKTHQDSEGFECVTCGFRARTKQLLKRHEKIHSGERAYRCEYCDFATRVGSHLLRHRRVHTGAKPFRCPHCDHRCNNLENLRKHVLHTNRHPGKSMYECRFCACESVFTTNLATEFRAHLAQDHPERFRSLAAAASFVAGIYDKDADPEHVEQVLPAKPRFSRKHHLTAGEVRVDIDDLPLADKASREELPTSLLPKHALLDAELFPVVVPEPDSPQDVVFIQLTEGDGEIVVLED